MKNDLTELVFILDRSGSMAGLESDTIGGYNAMLDRQKKGEGEAIVTTVLFDDEYELLHDRINIRGVAPITDEQYYVRGCTALLDAIGKTIGKISNAQRHTSPAERAGKVIVVITTDGLENASREFSSDRVKQLIEKQKTKHGWEFIFLGANIDAVAAAAAVGIDASRAVNYRPDAKGTRLNYEVISETVSSFRAGAPIPACWKDSIEEDFEGRG